MGIKAKCVFSMLLGLLAGVAQGQSSLGELLDKGGKPISKAEWMSMLPVTLTGDWQDRQGESRLSYKADGAVSGNARHYSNGTSSSAYGKWMAEESGKTCFDLQLPGWSTSNQQCWFLFKLGDEYFSAFGATVTDRSALILRRTLRR